MGILDWLFGHIPATSYFVINSLGDYLPVSSVEYQRLMQGMSPQELLDHNYRMLMLAAGISEDKCGKPHEYKWNGKAWYPLGENYQGPEPKWDGKIWFPLGEEVKKDD